MLLRRSRGSPALALVLSVAGCATDPAQGPPGPAAAPQAASPQAAPTVEEAQAFVGKLDKDLRHYWVARDRAAWVSENFITEDTEALAADGEQATADYMSRTIPLSTRFDGLALPPDIRRQLYLLKIAQTVPAPADPAQSSELAEIETWMTGTYGKGKYCPPKLKGQCLTLDDLEKTLAHSRDYGELMDAWQGWHEISKPMRPRYTRYVELANQGAKQIGFSDVGAMWKSRFDMPPEAFEAEEERLWQQVKPLYDSLHCYVRRRLRERYGAERVPAHGPIPVPMLGNMWGQEWNNIYDLVEPYPGQPSLDVSARLAAQKTSPQEMVKLGEHFFTSLGFPPLPQTFWERSLFARPRDREVVCHAEAEDIQWNGDLRVKVCLEPTEEDLITLHHELGHDFYFQSYDTLPMLFQQGANDGFHEGIGDTIALSVTPAYLKGIGLLGSVSDNPKARINQQMKMALAKVSFIPFGLLVDKWRWDVFSGKTDPAHYNQAWWDLKLKYQGEAAPMSRTEADFDPGAKFHIPSSSTYAPYFWALIYQFQFHRALCKVSGYTGPLEDCSIYGNRAAGDKLRAMLALGASKPWQQALQTLDGETQADASAVLEYFKPLQGWLDEQNKGEQCGW